MHQTITWTYVDLSPTVSLYIHLRGISQELLMNLSCNTSFKTSVIFPRGHRKKGTQLTSMWKCGATIAKKKDAPIGPDNVPAMIWVMA